MAIFYGNICAWTARSSEAPARFPWKQPRVSVFVSPPFAVCVLSRCALKFPLRAYHRLVVFVVAAANFLHVILMHLLIAFRLWIFGKFCYRFWPRFCRTKFLVSLRRFCEELVASFWMQPKLRPCQRTFINA